MDVFDYVAGSNPIVAKDIVQRFGYTPVGNDMAHSLRRLVSAEGEPALEQIMLSHPDFEYITSLSKGTEKKSKPAGCGCSASKDTGLFLNATGAMQQQTEASKAGDKFATAIVVSAFFFATLIFLKKD